MFSSLDRRVYSIVLADDSAPRIVQGIVEGATLAYKHRHLLVYIDAGLSYATIRQCLVTLTMRHGIVMTDLTRTRAKKG